MQRILIVGAGTAGTLLIRDLKKNHFNVVGFLDDNLVKNKEAKILGKLADVNAVIKDKHITDVYISIPSGEPELIRKFINKIESQKVKVSIIPPSFRIITRKSLTIKDLKPVDILFMLGRKQVKHDITQAKKLLKNKTVLITGAAGSIGSELTKQVIELGAKKVIALDWSENGVFNLKNDLRQYKNTEFVIANIQSEQRIEQIMQLYHPHIIFHAAAYKHVPLMQENSTEAFNNNVWGSLNMMQQAIKYEVNDFIYVSTDKAVNPINVMGSTKRIGEMLLEGLAAKQKKTILNAVRFGNVIASSGSVIPIFQKQIASGGPVTVTHKDVTRFFMTIEEAVQLIIQAWLLAKNGEIFVLDMGKPFKILDIAKNMIKFSGKKISIKFIGLRSGDKLYEELSYVPEKVERTRHPKIFVNKNEHNFNYPKFFSEIQRLLPITRNNKLSNKAMISKLKALGFKITL